MSRIFSVRYSSLLHHNMCMLSRNTETQKRIWYCNTKANPMLKLHSDLQRGTISGSMSRVHRDHSIYNALIRCTACARLIVFGLASESPMYFTLPSSTNFFSSPICKEINRRMDSYAHNYMIEIISNPYSLLYQHNLINSVLIVKINVECNWESLRSTWQSPYSLFYRHSLIDSVLIVKINVFHSEPLQTFLAARPQVLRLAIDHHTCGTRSRRGNPKLCGYLDLLTRQLLQGLKAICQKYQLLFTRCKFPHAGRQRSNEIRTFPSKTSLVRGP